MYSIFFGTNFIIGCLISVFIHISGYIHEDGFFSFRIFWWSVIFWTLSLWSVIFLDRGFLICRNPLLPCYHVQNGIFSFGFLLDKLLQAACYHDQGCSYHNRWWQQKLSRCCPKTDGGIKTRSASGKQGLGPSVFCRCGSL